MKWLFSIFLTVRFPEGYAFYRASLIDYACKAWGMDRPEGETEGERYSAYLKFLQTINEPLNLAFKRPVDLIDTHSFIWVEYNKDKKRRAAESWRDRLKEWLKTNPKTAPEELRRVREEFVKRFPKDKLRELTLEEYALGTGNSKDSLSHWLDYETKKLGALGGFVSKYGVWKKESGSGSRLTKMRMMR